MSLHQRQQRSRRARKNLAVEQLEPRELLAADVGLIAATLASPSNTVSTDAIALANTQSLNSTGSRILALAGIPTTTAAPRSIDGTGNNLTDPELGSTGEQLLRVAPADYGNGVDSLAGQDRPNPRVISDSVVAHDAGETPNDRQMSAYVYLWGQFIDHDIDLTEPPTSGAVEANIPVPAGDPLFDPTGTGAQVINFTRSRYDATTGTDASNPRQQINEITSWIDGSMVYGSDQATADSLRILSGGQLRTSAGNMLPMDSAGNFLAGDVRANENIELTAIQTLLMREHNYWAAKIAAANHKLANPNLTDEQIYQDARAIVIAEIQSITVNQWLPALLGTGAVPKYQGYDPTVNPIIANEFSTAVFRLGHSLVNDDVEFFGNDGTPVRDEVALKDAFFNPALVEQTGIDGILKYAGSTRSEELDSQIVDSLRNFLFGAPGQGGMDLAALNIQRGRDHGLADYNTVRAAYGLPRVTSFAQITTDPVLQQKLQDLYGSVDNIDLWVGALAEDHVAGSSTGPLVKAVISDQFERLRDGDRDWFENIFSGRQLAQLENTTLADVIRRNTTTTNIQSNVFFMQASVSGQVLANVNGRFSFRPIGVPNAAVNLVNSDGDVVATTTTGRDGRYRFTGIGETGNYQVVVTAPAGFELLSTGTQSVAITRGNVAMQGVNFALRLVGRFSGGGPLTSAPGSNQNPSGRLPVNQSSPTSTPADQDAAAAAAFAQLQQPEAKQGQLANVGVIARGDGLQTEAAHDAVFSAQDHKLSADGNSLTVAFANSLGD